MYFSDVSALINMGGHGFYVWLAFGFSVSWMSYLLINPLMKKNQLLKSICLQQQMEQNRNKP